MESLNDVPSRNLVAARRLLLLTYLAAAACYFSWRLTVLNHDQLLVSLAFVAAEFLGFLWSLNLIGWSAEFTHRAITVPPAGASVDVVIPTYNEPIDIVRRTLVAAIAIRYPHTTWLFDDGRREEMRTLATELGCRYVTREGNNDAKAGNLNAGMSQLSGEFLAIFDADHIAHPAFLDRTLGHFREAAVAFVQTPQEFYNFDSYQHLGADRARSGWNEHSLFYRVIQRNRDRINAAMLCGCSAVLRRSALDAIGGFATGTVTEDMHTSVRLHKSGWHSVMHPETLSAGLAPTGARDFRGQRLRWAQGALQVMMREKLYSPSTLTTRQRLCYLLHVLSHFEGFRSAFVYLLPAFALALNLAPITASFSAWMLATIPYVVISILTFEEAGRGHGRFLRNEVFNLARCTTSIRATWALAGRHIDFWVTPKTRDEQQAREGFALPWVILGVTAAAAALTAVRLGTGSLHAPLNAIAMTAAWAALSAVTSARLCLLTRRCRLNHRSGTRFPVTLSIDVVPTHGRAAITRATVTELSSSELSLTVRDGEPPAGKFAARLWLNGVAFSFYVDLRSAGRHAADATMAWTDQRARDRFDHALHVDRIEFLSAFDAVDRRTHLGWLAAAIAWMSQRVAISQRPATISVLLAVLAGLVMPAAADGQTVIPLTGIDGGAHSVYGYGGAIAALGGHLNSSGPVVRLWVDDLKYDFVGEDKVIEAKSHGGSVSAGYSWMRPMSSISLYAGFDARNTRFSVPLDRPNAGLRMGVRLQAEGNRRLGSRATADGIASFVTSTSDHWVRARTMFRLNESLSIGPEVVHQGSPTYKSSRAGAAIEGIPVMSRLRMSLNAGVEKNAVLKAGAYVAVSFVR